MKNYIFIPNIDKGQGSTRHQPYHYSIESWKRWADKNDCDVIVMDTPIVDPAEMTIPWQRYHLFDLLRSSDIEYNQILMVDADTIVHPNCPNFFDLSENKYCVVMDTGCFEWTGRSIRLYRDNLFNGYQLDRGKYFNGGFQIVNAAHKDFFDSVLDFYVKNKTKLLELQKQKLGTDQTAVNFLLQQSDVDVKMLPYTFNMHHMVSKNLLNFGQSWWGDSLQNMYEQGWVYHINAIPPSTLNRNTAYWMERIYKELWG